MKAKKKLKYMKDFGVKSDNYGEKYMKMKFNSDVELPLNKMIEIVVRVVFYENNKYYPQVLLDECLYKL